MWRLCLVLCALMTRMSASSDLLIRYGCQGEACTFEIDMDQKLASYVDTSTIVIALNNIQAELIGFDSIEDSIKSYLANFTTAFDAAYPSVENEYQSLAGGVSTLGETLGDLPDQSEDLSLEVRACHRAVHVQVDANLQLARCLYENQADVAACSGL